MSNNDKNRGGGLMKPSVGNRKISFSGKCDVRLSAAEDSALSELASRNNVSRSDIMRRALRDFLKFNGSSEE